MLYIVPYLEAAEKKSTSLVFFRDQLFYSMHTESPCGLSLLTYKRQYFVLEVDPNILYRNKDGIYRGKIIGRDNTIYHVKANSAEQLLKLVVYQKVGQSVIDFFVDIKNAKLFANKHKYIKFAHHIRDNV